MSKLYDLKKRIASANASLTTIQRLYGKDSSIMKHFTSAIQKAGGKTRFSAKMFDGSLRQIAKATNVLEMFENSSYSSKAGRLEIGRKARETFALRHDTYDDVTISKMYHVFKNSSFSRFDEVYKHSSELFVDAIMSAFEDDGMSVRKVEKKIDYFLSHLDEFMSGNNPDYIKATSENRNTVAVENFKKWLLK